MTEKVECSEDKILQEDLDFIAESNIPFEKLNNSSILITGGTGLVGISIIRALLCVIVKKICISGYLHLCVMKKKPRNYMEIY